MKKIIFSFIAVAALAAAYAAEPRPEHPRPQFQRDKWLNLNGEWSYELDNARSGRERKLFESTGFRDRIMVPFCPESRLSGVEHKDFILSIWYHRTLRLPEGWSGQKIMLRFGAVYYESEIYIDGKFVGRHTGGSDSFAFDVTEYLSDTQEHHLVVRADSNLRDRQQGGGKQSLLYDSHGCYYTRTTGIWQTVWLEAMSEYSIENVQVFTDIDQKQIVIVPEYSAMRSGCTLTVTVADGGRTIAEKSVAAANGTPAVIPLKKFECWSPENPKLYDVTYTLKDSGGKVVDRVESYVGMRKIHVGGNKIYLNNEPFYQRLVLDQGFYPDGIWTAPDDEALRRDIEMSKAAGFNGARLHQKVFEERFHYWADKLGYLCWGEFASWGMDETSPVAARNFMAEWTNIVVRDRNCPSIVAWTPFNEAWHPDNVEYPRMVQDVYMLTHALDPTRPVNTVSGGALTPYYDICCMHNYEQNPEKLSKKIYDSETDSFFNYKPKTSSKKYTNAAVIEGADDSKAPYYVARYDRRKPYLMDEFGGIKCLETNTTTDIAGKERKTSWGYGNSAATREEFYERLEGQVDALLALADKVWGFCYTQLTDVEQEENGIYYYDRRPKFDIGRIHAIFSKPLPAAGDAAAQK